LKIFKYFAGNSCAHSLQHFFKYALIFEPLRLCALLATTTFQQFPQVVIPETLLGLRTPCTAPVLNLHFRENENNVFPPELSEIKTLNLSTHSLWTLHCTPCWNSFSDRETIETHFLLSLSDFKHSTRNHSYIVYQQMHNRKSKITISIAFNIHTQKALEHHESKIKASYINFRTSVHGFFCRALCFFSSMLYAQLTIGNVNVSNDTR
jgi:hypothetical protein